MGARTTWRIITNDDAAIWLYSHSGGEDKFVDTQNAVVASMARRGDLVHDYEARIFISSIIGERWAFATGFGITATAFYAETPYDETYFTATIDFTSGRVTFGSREWTFDEFITAADCSDKLIAEFYGEELVF